MDANTITHNPVMALLSIVGKSSSRLETNVQILKLRTPVLLVGSITLCCNYPLPCMGNIVTGESFSGITLMVMTQTMIIMTINGKTV